MQALVLLTQQADGSVGIGTSTPTEAKAQQSIETGDMQKRMLGKMEEMYRYMFEISKKYKSLKEELELTSKQQRN